MTCMLLSILDLCEVCYRLIEGAYFVKGQASVMVCMSVVWIDPQHCSIVCNGQLVFMILYVLKCVYVCTYIFEIIEMEYEPERTCKRDCYMLSCCSDTV